MDPDVQKALIYAVVTLAPIGLTFWQTLRTQRIAKEASDAASAASVSAETAAKATDTNTKETKLFRQFLDGKFTLKLEELAKAYEKTAADNPHDEDAASQAKAARSVADDRKAMAPPQPPLLPGPREHL